MFHTNKSINNFKNSDSPFTELFSLLKGMQTSNLILPYHSQELKVLNRDIDNALDLLLQGMQDLGYVMSVAGQNKESVRKEINNLGFFISAISNLAQALNILRLDSNYTLEQKK